MKGLPGGAFRRVFDGLQPFWGAGELALLGAVLYHYACAEGRRDVANRLLDELKPKEARMSNPGTVRKRFWEVWTDEGRVEGEARKEQQLLREQTDAIHAFFSRKGLPWETYAADVERLPSHREATDFLVDLATAADLGAFLKQRFGH